MTRSSPRPATGCIALERQLRCSTATRTCGALRLEGRRWAAFRRDLRDASACRLDDGDRLMGGPPRTAVTAVLAAAQRRPAPASRSRRCADGRGRCSTDPTVRRSARRGVAGGAGLRAARCSSTRSAARSARGRAEGRQAHDPLIDAQRARPLPRRDAASRRRRSSSTSTTSTASCSRATTHGSSRSPARRRQR